MNTNPDPVSTDLLVAYLCGECQPHEKLHVRQWIEASEENKARFAEIQRIWQVAETAYPSSFDTNTDASWDKVNRRIFVEDHTKIVVQMKPDPKRLFFKKAILVAAVLIPLVTVALYFFFQTKTPRILSVDSKDSIVFTQLSEGTIIRLNQGSNLNYPEKFTGKRREITLSGEAYFKVYHDALKPFVVHTETIDINVLGTEFDVKAYPRHEKTEVTVMSGRVAIFSIDHDKTYTDSLSLEPGYKGVYTASTNRLECFKLSDANDLFWINKTLEFSEKELSVVFDKLESAYKITIVPKDSSLLKLRLTTVFQDQPIDSIMSVIGETFGLKVVNKNKTYEVDRQRKE